MLKRKTENQLFECNKKQNFSKLQERFLIPPFSIFDTKQGYWQQRKRTWLDLGIKSELGRGDNLLNYNEEEIKKNKFGKCLPASIGEAYGRKNMQATSIFDPVLCEICYRWFSNKDDLILDCFAGGSVRGIVASYLDRNYIGIDLKSEQIEANNLNFKEIVAKKPIDYIPTWICGNSLNIKNLTNNKKVDLIFSCPPYYDLEIYSDLDGDISNCETYKDFKKDYFKIIKETCDLLKEDRFAIFVVGEFRNKLGFYENFIGDTVTAFKEAGLQYYNEAILQTSIGTLPVRITKQFNAGRKLGKTHQNILIFYKGNPKNIKNNYKDLIIE